MVAKTVNSPADAVSVERFIIKITLVNGSDRRFVKMQPAVGKGKPQFLSCPQRIAAAGDDQNVRPADFVQHGRTNQHPANFPDVYSVAGALRIDVVF